MLFPESTSAAALASLHVGESGVAKAVDMTASALGCRGYGDDNIHTPGWSLGILLAVKANTPEGGGGCRQIEQ